MASAHDRDTKRRPEGPGCQRSWQEPGARVRVRPPHGHRLPHAPAHAGAHACPHGHVTCVDTRTHMHALPCPRAHAAHVVTHMRTGTRIHTRDGTRAQWDYSGRGDLGSRGTALLFPQHVFPQGRKQEGTRGRKREGEAAARRKPAPAGRTLAAVWGGHGDGHTDGCRRAAACPHGVRAPCSSSAQTLEGGSFGNMVARPLPPSRPGAPSWERRSAGRRAAGVSRGRSTPPHLSETRGPVGAGICPLLQEASPGCLLFHKRRPRTATRSSPCHSP